MKYFTYIILTLFLLNLSFSTLALDPKQAKKEGLIGQQADGYIGIVNQESSSEELRQLVDKVNAGRKAKYQEISKKTGSDLLSTEKVAGQKLIEKTPTGQYIQNSSGKWIKK